MDEIVLLRARAEDCRQLAEKRGAASAFGFLNLALAGVLRTDYAKDPSVGFFGGYPDAERVMVAFSATGAPPETWDYPLSLVLYQYSADAPITHRDILGSLMGQKITRECVGDILVQPGRAVAVMRDSILPVALELSQIGHTPVMASQIDCLPDGFEQKTEPMRTTIASMRLDCIVSELARCSREGADDLIRKKLVFMDGLPACKGDRKCVVPCVISLRGIGKFRLTGDQGRTKKDRIVLEYEQYC